MTTETTKATETTARATRVDTPTFVKLWQTSESLADFCEKSGLAESTATQRASMIRGQFKKATGKSILKKFKIRKSRNDWAGLAELAASFLDDEEGDEAEAEVEAPVADEDASDDEIDEDASDEDEDEDGEADGEPEGEDSEWE